LLISIYFTIFAEAERLYWKDAECPSAWKEWLQDGDTIPTDLLVDGPGDLFRYRPKTVRRLQLLFGGD